MISAFSSIRVIDICY